MPASDEDHYAPTEVHCGGESLGVEVESDDCGPGGVRINHPSSPAGGPGVSDEIGLNFDQIYYNLII